MAKTSTIKEYLVKLGFKVDDPSFKKFNDAMLSGTKTAFKIGTVTTAAALEIEAGVARITRQMEELYYTSRRAGTTASNYKALGQAATSVGISADDMGASIKGVASTLRSNPAMVNFVQSFGVQVKGRDISRVAIDYVRALRELGKQGPYQYSIAEQMAGQVGISKDVFFDLTRPGAIEKLQAANDARHEAYNRMGLDYDAAAKSSVDFQNKLRSLGYDFDALTAKIGMDFKPQGEWLIEWAHRGVFAFADWNKQADGIPGRIAAIAAAATTSAGGLSLLLKLLGFGGAAGAVAGVTGAAVAGTAFTVGAGALTIHGNNKALAQTGGSFYDPETGAVIMPGPAGSGTVTPSAGTSSNPLTDWIRAASAKYGINAEIFRRLIMQESRGKQYWDNGKLKVSKKGAIGLTQLMPGTAAMMGVDPTDPMQNVFGGARYLSERLKEFGGDYVKAIASYNAGPGAVHKYGGVPPYAETQNYVASILGTRLGTTLGDVGAGRVNIQQKTDIHVAGGHDPSATGRAVASEQGRVNGDLVRNFAAAVQ